MTIILDVNTLPIETAISPLALPLRGEKEGLKS